MLYECAEWPARFAGIRDNRSFFVNLRRALLSDRAMRWNRGVDRQLGAGEASLRRGNGFFCLIVESPTRDSPSGDFAGPTWAVHHAEYVRSRLLNTEREPL
jgi:hypothetical protein